MGAVGGLAQLVQLWVQMSQLNSGATAVASNGIVVSKLRLVSLSVFVLAAIALSVFGFYRSMTRVAGAGPITIANVESKIRGWLDTFHLGTQKLAEADGRYFALLVTNHHDRKVIISRQKALEQYLAIQTRVTVGPDHLKQLEALPEADKDILIRNLTIEMARLRIGFTAVGRPLKNVTLEKMLPITDDLTEASFIEAINDVDKAELLVLMFIPGQIEELAGKKR